MIGLTEENLYYILIAVFLIFICVIYTYIIENYKD